jgi:hypothetical protein
MSNVCSGYFAALCAQKRNADALRTLEEIRGQIETEALEHHVNLPVRPPSPEEREFTRLNVTLLNSEDTKDRERLSNAIYNAELSMSPSSVVQESIAPVRLTQLQRTLSSKALLIEYLRVEPNSYALAIPRPT